MIDQLVNWIIVFNFLILVGLVIRLRWWTKKYGKITGKTFALILTSYFSFAFITPLLPSLITHPKVTILVDAIFLLILWCLGYPWVRWLYDQFDLSK